MSLLDGWRFCPRCRTELDRGAPRRVECPACGFAAYANPAPTACALCVDDEGRLLLARRATPLFEGFWDTPGGFVEEGEHPLEALRREVREETGLAVEPTAFLGAWMDWYAEAGEGEGAVSTLNLYWSARVLGGEPQAADDVSELCWFAPDELPPDEELAFANVREVLAAWRAAQLAP
ncbi:MAG: NUDIX domain-containing protein [Actinobacteria bacterium]|nr:NUDIX domain-containing protein [Actinomycetota bacterium]